MGAVAPVTVRRARHDPREGASEPFGLSAHSFLINEAEKGHAASPEREAPTEGRIFRGVPTIWPPKRCKPTAMRRPSISR
jgi:hypothetical protein